MNASASLHRQHLPQRGSGIDRSRRRRARTLLLAVLALSSLCVPRVAAQSGLRGHAFELESRSRWLHGSQQPELIPFSAHVRWVHLDGAAPGATGGRVLSGLLGSSARRSGLAFRIETDTRGLPGWIGIDPPVSSESWVEGGELQLPEAQLWDLVPPPPTELRAGARWSDTLRLGAEHDGARQQYTAERASVVLGDTVVGGVRLWIVSDSARIEYSERLVQFDRSLDTLAAIERTGRGVLRGRHLFDPDLRLYRARADTTTITGAVVQLLPDGRQFQSPARYERYRIVVLHDPEGLAARVQAIEALRRQAEVAAARGAGRDTERRLRAGDARLADSLFTAWRVTRDPDRRLGIERLLLGSAHGALRAADVIDSLRFAYGDTAAAISRITEAFSRRPVTLPETRLLLRFQGDPGLVLAHGLSPDRLYTDPLEALLRAPPAFTTDTASWPCTPEACRALARQWEEAGEPRLRDLGLVTRFLMDPPRWERVLAGRAAEGCRPCRRVLEETAKRSAGDAPSAPPPAAPQSPLRIPIVDLAGESARQVVVDRVPGKYLGHPTTVLLEDGRTLLAVYPEGHGRGPIVLRRSGDGGRTWSARQPVPESWRTSQETPTIHRVVDASGKRRLILFSGLHPIRMSVSEDEGATWTQLGAIGDFGGIVAMASLDRLRDGRYMALFHDDGRFLRNTGNAGRFRVYRTLSADGGLTWGEPEVIAEHATARLCEPGLVRSPDDRQIAVLLRENSRTRNSFIIFSDDEGDTWTEPRELPPALTGDRHVAKYAADGRLFITFRDMADGSPTKGDWVGWVGTYDDLVRGRDGQYRVRIMDNTHESDAAYAGLERLPDGTFVTTSYGHWVTGEQPFIVSVRFRLEELDARVPGRVADQGAGPWNPDSLGNHRAVIRVETAGPAVRIHIPWRRRDAAAADRSVIVTDASGARVADVARIAIDREAGDLAFRPASGPGTYYVYFMPYATTGGNYPKVTYPVPVAMADSGWLRAHGLRPDDLASGAWRALPAASWDGSEPVDAFDSFWPMEEIATRAELETLLAAHPEAWLVFPEDRGYPIRMTRDLPARWIRTGPGATLRGDASRGEWYAFQLGIWAAREPLEDVRVTFASLARAGADDTVPAAAFHCINPSGNDWLGRPFTRRVPVARGAVQAIWCGVQIPESAEPGEYRADITVTAPAGPSARVALVLRVTPDVIAHAGDDEPWRLSRLRWLDSRLAIDDEIVRPYTAVELRGDTVSVLGRDVVLGASGLPARIRSRFTPAMTAVGTTARDVLAAPVELRVRDAAGRALRWTGGARRITKRAPGAVAWEVTNTAPGVSLTVGATMEFDGVIEFANSLRADRVLELGDVVLRIPLAPDVARYMLGMGRKGGLRPDSLDWSWDAARNQDGAWIGDVNAGLQFALRDEHYARPLNTNFYQLKPLVMPGSWWNRGAGGCRLRAEARAYVVECSGGRRTLRAGETLRFDFRLTLTPFRPLDTRSQFATRYYHRYTPLDSIAMLGANTVNVHHATRINPWINYPFLRPAAMKAYVDSAHTREMKVKIYYTVRELSNRAPELFALRSLGDEVLSRGPGGGPPWLQEHLGDDYIAGWYVPALRDAAVINSGVSRWHNYYVEGLDWLARNVGIDGLYIDDVAFDRTVMKRVRKVLDRSRPGALIDLHSANQFNPRDGFANSANLYLEHFPYIDRLWFGEYFDYGSPPEYWLTEVSGIPFGLMGEMLQDGGNAWRGMVYGMTARLPWAGDPRPLWQAWDDFGIVDARMIGYWAEDAPVQTGHADVLATSYLREGAALVAIASWADAPVDVRLQVDWRALGIDRDRARIVAHAIEGFQPAREFRVGEPVPVEPGRGWLLEFRSAG